MAMHRVWYMAPDKPSTDFLDYFAEFNPRIQETKLDLTNCTPLQTAGRKLRLACGQKICGKIKTPLFFAFSFSVLHLEWLTVVF